MTLDELNRLEKLAEGTKQARDGAVESAKRLAMERNADPIKPASDLISMIWNRWDYYSTRPARSEFFAVLEEFLPDLLRIAEMRLEAKARTLGQEERALRAQIDGFLSEAGGLS